MSLIPIAQGASAIDGRQPGGSVVQTHRSELGTPITVALVVSHRDSPQCSRSRQALDEAPKRPNSGEFGYARELKHKDTRDTKEEGLWLGAMLHAFRRGHKVRQVSVPVSEAARLWGNRKAGPNSGEFGYRAIARRRGSKGHSPS